jgi:hypothetical protein
VHVRTRRPRARKRPQCHAQQRHPYDAFTDAGDTLDRKKLAERDQEQPDRHNTRGMTEPPLEPGSPWRSTAVCRQRRNRNEMIGAGEDVQQARGES